jgi:pimeloyl-ACP methyl ester carboxylesterase
MQRRGVDRVGTTYRVSSDTRYARSADVHVAYRVFGAGPCDVVFAMGLDFPSVEFHDHAIGAGFEDLTGRMRVIRFDKRGTGASDPVSGVPSLEERMDDVRAVMDAVGSERAALLGHVDGAAMAILFAATYPERVFALVLFQGKPRFVRAPDFPWVPTREQYELGTDRWLAQLQSSGELEQAFAMRLNKPASHPDVLERVRATRLTMSPGALKSLRRMNMDVDVRSALATIQAPTLIVHRTVELDDETDTSGKEIARYMASSIAGSRLLEIGRFDWLPYREIGDFVMEAWEQRAVERRRVLATVLFSDLVDSTATAVGDRVARAARGAQCGRPARARALSGRDHRHRRRRLLRIRLRRTRARNSLRLRDSGGRQRARPRHPRRRAHGGMRRRRRQARRSGGRHRRQGRRSGGRR